MAAAMKEVTHVNPRPLSPSTTSRAGPVYANGAHARSNANFRPRHSEQASTGQGSGAPQRPQHDAIGCMRAAHGGQTGAPESSGSRHAAHNGGTTSDRNERARNERARGPAMPIIMRRSA